MTFLLSLITSIKVLMGSVVLLVESPVDCFDSYHCDTNTWRSLSLYYLQSKITLLVTYLEVSFQLEVTRSPMSRYEFDEASQQWVKSGTISPMPTVRSLATVATWTTAQVSALFVAMWRKRQQIKDSGRRWHFSCLYFSVAHRSISTAS
jgi:hypothetical protein